MNSITAVVGKGVMMKHFLTIIKWGSIVTVMSSFMGMIQGIYEYLTEENLGIFLNKHYSNAIRDRTVPDSNCRFRPDFRLEKEKLIIEFDGYGHYTNPTTIINDLKKDEIYSNLGFKVIRFPYFIQLNEKTIFDLLSLKIKIKQIYPHGFIDKKAPLPACFCELGIEKFLKDLEKFHYLKKDIIKSLKEKCDSLGNELLVLPKSLLGFLK